MSLSKGAFRDSLRMRYGLELLNMPKKCDGCGAKFSVEHALGCKKGGLVTVRHNEVRDELAYLATLATSSSRVRDEPLIQICHSFAQLVYQAQLKRKQRLPPQPRTQYMSMATGSIEATYSYMACTRNRPPVFLTFASRIRINHHIALLLLKWLSRGRKL